MKHKMHASVHFVTKIISGFLSCLLISNFDLFAFLFSKSMSLLHDDFPGLEDEINKYIIPQLSRFSMTCKTLLYWDFCLSHAPRWKEACIKT